MDYDLIVIGAGPGGHAAALEAARLARKVLIVEKKTWGGTCTHKGCIPTKALLTCSRRYHELRNLKRLGITVENSGFDFEAIKRHQSQMVKLSALGVRKSLQDLGVNCTEGEAVILSPDEVEIALPNGKTDRVRSKNLVISWGSAISPLPDFPFSNRVISSDTLLDMDRLPDSLSIIGGGSIGVEFAAFLAEVGVKVTLIELMDHILPNEDPDVADFLTGELKKTGVAVYTATTIRKVIETGNSVRMELVNKDKIFEIDTDYCLISVGRKPSLRAEELDRLGVAYSGKGIFVDDRCMTNINGVFAAGDVTGGILLAHRASAQGRTVARFLFADHSARHTDDAVPAVVYSHPPVARVGLTETKAHERGLEIDVRKKEYGTNIIARTELMGNGFVKTLFHQDRLFGAAIAGDQAPDLIASFSLAISHGMSEKDLRNWIIPHPTLSELLDL
jgi:dihydrolipoamide dehydrogenase